MNELVRGPSSVVRCFLDLIDSDRLAAASVVRCSWSVVSWTGSTETARIDGDCPDRCRLQHGNMLAPFRTFADGHPTTDHGLRTTDMEQKLAAKA